MIPQCLPIQILKTEFNLLDLSPAVWAEADFGAYSDTGVTPCVNGSLVRQWNDRSGFSRHFGQATSGSRPTLVTNAVNGLPAVRFDGSNDYMKTPSFTLNNPQTVFVVVKIRTAGPSTYLYDGLASNTLVGRQLASAGGTFCINPGNDNPNVTVGTADFVILSARYNTLVEPRLRIRVNDDSPVTLSDSSQNATGVTIGSYAGADGLFSAIDLAAFIVIPRSVTTQEETNVLTYLNSKYAIFSLMLLVAGGASYLALQSGAALLMGGA